MIREGYDSVDIGFPGNSVMRLGWVTADAVQNVFDEMKGIDIAEFTSGNQAVMDGRRVSTSATAWKEAVLVAQGHATDCSFSQIVVDR